MTKQDDTTRMTPGIEPKPVWVPPGPTAVEVATGSISGIGAVLAAPLLQARVIGAMGSLVNRAPPPHAPGTSGRISEPGAASEMGSPDWATGVGDPGWFGPTSVAWKVHADTAMFVAGVTAFVLQTLHPLALAGVADHSSFAQDFLGRTRRTGEFVSGVVYGSSAEAEARVAGVHRVHQRVVGSAPDGRPYSANDPDLLAWVHLTEYLAIASSFRRFGLWPLSGSELDRYVAEVAIVGEAMGVANPPRSWAALDSAFQRFRPDLAVGEQGAAAVRFLQAPPGLPTAAQAAWRIVWAGGVACLPPIGRDLLGLRAPPRGQLVACRSLVRALAAVLGPPPPLLAARKRLGLSA